MGEFLRDQRATDTQSFFEDVGFIMYVLSLSSLYDGANILVVTRGSASNSIQSQSGSKSMNFEL